MAALTRKKVFKLLLTTIEDVSGESLDYDEIEELADRIADMLVEHVDGVYDAEGATVSTFGEEPPESGMED